MSKELSLAEKGKLERNRQIALLKLAKKEQYKKLNDTDIISNGSTFIDSHAGFLISKDGDRKRLKTTNVVEENNDSTDEQYCSLCTSQFDSSFLKKNFDIVICDKCRDPDIHKLVNKTSAKEIYLLNDVDLSVRRPTLKYIIKPNPKNSTWGDMKLYLEAQVAQRAIEIWGSEEGLEAERNKRVEKNDKMKILRYQRKIKGMRDNMRVPDVKFGQMGHRHVYADGEDKYDEERDVYVQTCTECGMVDTYEKM